MASFADAIAGLGFAMKTLKDLREIERGVDEATFKLKIADLTSTVADAKIALTEVQDDLREKDETIKSLRAALKTKEETVKLNGFHYVSDDGEAVGMPLCPICIEDGSFQRLAYSTSGSAFCPKCKASFGRVSGRLNPKGL